MRLEEIRDEIKRLSESGSEDAPQRIRALHREYRELSQEPRKAEQPTEEQRWNEVILMRRGFSPASRVIGGP